MTSTWMDELMIPCELLATHMYAPSSDCITLGKWRVPFASIRWLGNWKSGSPSYTQGKGMEKTVLQSIGMYISYMYVIIA